jgi:hypothetical protein
MLNLIINLFVSILTPVPRHPVLYRATAGLHRGVPSPPLLHRRPRHRHLRPDRCVRVGGGGARDRDDLRAGVHIYIRQIDGWMDYYKAIAYLRRRVPIDLLDFGRGDEYHVRVRGGEVVCERILLILFSKFINIITVFQFLRCLLMTKIYP